MFYIVVFEVTYFLFKELHKRNKLLKIDKAFVSWLAVICTVYAYIMVAMLGADRIDKSYNYEISSYKLNTDGVEFITSDGEVKTIVGDVAFVDTDSDKMSISYKSQYRDVKVWQEVLFFDKLFIGMWERDMVLGCVITE